MEKKTTFNYQQLEVLVRVSSSLAKGSQGSIHRNKKYIPPTSPSTEKELITITAEDENGNIAFETVTLFPALRINQSKTRVNCQCAFFREK